MNNCPYCGKSGDLYFAVYSKRFHRCIACDLIYRKISESYGDAVASYNTNYFDRYSIDQVEGQRFRLYDHILELVAENREPGKLLDVGTGCGFFLVAAQKRQWKVKGVEPSIQSVEMARAHNSLDVFHGTLGEYGRNGRFDVITFINVLDHSTLPWLEINRASELLLPGGLIYLRFPNGFLHSRINRLIHKFGLSNALDKFLVFHEYCFTPRYIRRLLHDHGFIQTTIRNSPPSEGDPHGLFPHPNLATYVKKFIYSMAKCTEITSFGRLLLGTSLAVTAVKSDYQQA
jgi:2-polyprenyl-3-methyl-5-hydroxy-6-metoxy-1,4-benzoquinol methylase